MADSKRSLEIGVAYLGYATYPGTGVPATSYTEIEDIFKGSVVFNFSDANQIKIEIEKTPDPRWILNQKGDADSIEFAIPSPSVDDMVAFCGGKKVGEKWEQPNEIPNINMSIKISTQPYEGKYVEYVIVNGSVFGKISQAPGKEQSELLLVKVTKQTAATSDGTLKTPFTREVKKITTIPVTAVAISGTPKVGTPLTALPTPNQAAGTYQWMKKTGSETSVEISSATNQVYIPSAGDVGAKLSVRFTAEGSYTGTVTSADSIAVVA